jgi:hypothetical protein
MAKKKDELNSDTDIANIDDFKYPKSHAQLKEKGNRMIKYNFGQMCSAY